jgi:hypothetical protein
LKTCPRCGVDKEYDQYSKNKSCKDGLQFYCKICLSLLTKERAEKRSKIVFTQTFKTCGTCKISRPVTCFTKDAYGTFGLKGNCIDCGKIAIAAWMDENPERRKENQKEWNRNNPDKVKNWHQKWRINNPEKLVEYRPHANEIRRTKRLFSAIGEAPEINLEDQAI